MHHQARRPAMPPGGNDTPGLDARHPDPFALEKLVRRGKRILIAYPLTVWDCPGPQHGETNMTKLHDALTEAGIESLDYTDVKAGESFSLPIGNVPDETIISQLVYGRRMFNDALNGGDQDDRAARAVELRTRLVDGWTRGHGGGKRLDPVEREARDVVIGLMVEKRFKTTDARKYVTKDGAEKAFRTHVADDDAKWTTVRDHAANIAAMKATGPSINV